MTQLTFAYSTAVVARGPLVNGQRVEQALMRSQILWLTFVGLLFFSVPNFVLPSMSLRESNFVGLLVASLLGLAIAIQTRSRSTPVVQVAGVVVHICGAVCVAHALQHAISLNLSWLVFALFLTTTNALFSLERKILRITTAFAAWVACLAWVISASATIAEALPAAVPLTLGAVVLAIEQEGWFAFVKHADLDEPGVGRALAIRIAEVTLIATLVPVAAFIIVLFQESN